MLCSEPHIENPPDIYVQFITLTLLLSLLVAHFDWRSSPLGVLFVAVPFGHLMVHRRIEITDSIHSVYPTRLSLYFFCLDNYSIDDRREAVVFKRQNVKSLSNERARKLQASLAWQQFSRDSDEVRLMESVLKNMGKAVGVVNHSVAIFIKYFVLKEGRVYLGNRHPLIPRGLVMVYRRLLS